MILDEPYFHSDPAAYEYLEHLLWPQGPVCSYCGAVDNSTTMQGNTVRLGLRCCRACHRQFRVTIGTVFEGSHTPLYKWFQACFLLSATTRRINLYQLQLRLRVNAKTVRRLAEQIELATGLKPAKGARLTDLNHFPEETDAPDTPPVASVQYRLFVEAARALGCGELDRVFESRLKRLALWRPADHQADAGA